MHIITSCGKDFGVVHGLQSGRVVDQQHKVCCHSKRDQHAAAQQGSPNISRLDIDQQMHWDHAANVHLGNTDIKPHHTKKS